VRLFLNFRKKEKTAMFKKQGTSKRSASTSIGDIKPGFHEATPTDMGEKASACDMAWAFEELELCEELSEVQLATVVGGIIHYS
jgi:hypothetical protein